MFGIGSSAGVIHLFPQCRKLLPEGINVRSMKRGIAGFATALLLSGGLGLAGLELGTGTAQADPGFAQTPYAPKGPNQWCPGQALPYNDTTIVWDMNVCHTWWRVAYGFQGNRGKGFIFEGDAPPADIGCVPLLCLPGL
jgi:hypothetical protein